MNLLLSKALNTNTINPSNPSGQGVPAFVEGEF